VSDPCRDRLLSPYTLRVITADRSACPARQLVVSQVGIDEEPDERRQFYHEIPRESLHVRNSAGILAQIQHLVEQMPTRGIDTVKAEIVAAARRSRTANARWRMRVPRRGKWSAGDRAATSAIAGTAARDRCDGRPR